MRPLDVEADLERPARVPAGNVLPPVWLTFLKHPFAVVQAGSPYCELNTPRSASASDRRSVDDRDRPSAAGGRRRREAYTLLIVCGDRPYGAELASGLPRSSVLTNAWQCAASAAGPGHTAPSVCVMFAPWAPRTAVRAATGHYPTRENDEPPLMSLLLTWRNLRRMVGGNQAKRPSPHQGQRRPRCRLIENGFVRFFADLTVRRPRTVLAVAGALAVVAAAFGWQTPGLLGRASNDFVAKGSESLRAEAAVERASGLSAAPQLLVLVRDPNRAAPRAGRPARPRGAGLPVALADALLTRREARRSSPPTRARGSRSGCGVGRRSVSLRGSRRCRGRRWAGPRSQPCRSTTRSSTT